MFLNKSLLSLGIITLLLPLSLPLSSITATKQEEYPSPTHNLLAATNQKRLALIIGNSQYQAGNTLRNPVNDANDITQALRELGFEVILVLDANKKQMDKAIEEFSRKLARSGVGLFYYAGHGVQVDGENFLIPVDANLNSEKDVYYESLPLGKIQNAMEEANTDLNIIILDACRDNPFGRRWNRSTQVRGLAVVQALSSSYIAFATAPGKTAADGTGKNGVFTSHLLQHIKTPNLGIDELFRRVRQGVAKETDKKQTPWSSSSLFDEFSFNSVTETVATQTPQPKPSPTPTTSASRNSENSEVAAVTPKPTPTPTTQPSSLPTTNLISYTPKKIFLERTLTGHSKPIWSIAISPDGDTFVSGSGDGTIKIWDLATGEQIHTLIDDSGSVFSVAISPDGRTLLSGSDDNTIKIWNLTTGELIRTLTGHSKWVNSLAISPDGDTLVSGSDDNTIKIWNLATGKVIRTLTDHSEGVSSVAISPDGQTLVSGSHDKTIKIWNLATGELLHTLTEHSNSVKLVAISPDGQTLISGSDDKTLKIWNLATGKLIHTLTGHSESVSSVAVSPNGQTLVSSSYDNTIKIWNLETGELLRTLTNYSDLMSINLVAISPDGNRIISSNDNGKIYIWQASR